MAETMVALNNGVEIPALGLGRVQSEGSEATSAVSTVLQSGYRLIDTAAAYFNERDVGQGIRDSGVDRADLFLTTKLWMTDYGVDDALRAFETSTAKLGVDYLDLYLLHWPWPANWKDTIAWVDVPRQIGGSPAQNLILLLQQAVALLQLPHLRRLGRCRAGPGFLALGDGNSAFQCRDRKPEILRNLRQRRSPCGPHQ